MKNKKKKRNFFGEWNDAIQKIDFFKNSVKPNVNGSFCAGDKFAHKEGNGYIKVMAIADGYVMARNKGCIPFCEKIDEFIVRLEKNCR